MMINSVLPSFPRCLSLLLHILPYPGELAPPQLHSSRQQGPPQVCLCSPGNQIPRNGCTMDANRQWRGTESNQSESFCLPWPNPTGNDSWCQHPCVSWRTQRYCSQAGRGPQDLIAHIKTVMDCWEMINDEHRKHELHCCIIHAYHHEGKLLGKLMAIHSRHPPISWLTLLWNTLPSNTPENESHTAPNLWTQSTRTKGRCSRPATITMVTHHLLPPRTVPTAHNSTQQEEQTALHVIPIVPNATRWDTGDQNAVVASHSNQGTHLHLGHSRGSPDAHLGTTTTAEGGATRQTPQMSMRTKALKMR